ncbi:aminotransferase class I/II-fold pyridoxal phosphate-dependent enzyme [Streptomyces sp. NPDC056056]|uniref:aminotransferase class I/II-fold pyridoxal phosphate-dependent enzyme n=1 Tax=Streptomyces sp. NPDC056056 TaxID=3345698 RepID=UPI0035D60ED8
MDLLDKCRVVGAADDTRALGLYPYYPGSQGPAGRGQVLLDGAEVCMLGSSDYRALSSNPQILAAAQDALALYGTSATGPRHQSGNLELHEELEADLAGFFGFEAALVFSTGYMANLGVVSCLVGREDVVVVDERAHASLVDGARLAGANGAGMLSYQHCSPDALAEALVTAAGRPALVVTDALFADSGRAAPVAQLVEVCARFGATLLVDESHGVGLLGRGRGVVHHSGMTGRVPLMTVSFGTSLASQGGAVLSDARTIDYLRHHCRPQLYSAGLSPAETAAAHASLREIRRHAERAPDALAAAENLRAALAVMGFDVEESLGPIIPVRFASEQAMLSAQRLLLDHGIYANAVLATAGSGHRLRVVCTDAHTPEALDAVIAVFGQLREDLIPPRSQPT